MIRKARRVSGRAARPERSSPRAASRGPALYAPRPGRIPLRFTPGVHVNYSETVLPMRDGLPKLKDFPAEFGGSGEMMQE